MNTQCEHFGRCGGCTYLDIPYLQELEIKEKALVEALGDYGYLVEKLHPAPHVAGYRNKMELAFGDEGKDGRMALGMRKQRSFYEVATPENCILICDDFKRVIVHVLEYFRQSGEMVYHRKRHIGALRHLVLRRGEFTGEILLNLSTASALKTPLGPLVEGLCGLKVDGKIVGILHSVNDGVADVVKNENVNLLYGRDYYNEEICGLKFKVSAFSFFQTNSAGAEVLYGLVRSYAASCHTRLAYDLYCGTGTIAQILSPYFDKILGVEIVEDAIKAAKDNAQLNGITNCSFYAGDVQDIIKQHPAAPDVVVVDPPRDGLHPKAMPQIVALNAPQLVYVACKPKSLARDLNLLVAAGYNVEKIEGMDMFPRTPHVETISLLRRRY
ncbi:MAG: 23S rRNA (uracil(1939)-C(5))-methyltransferase RlmD [Firmicutes bacterium]|nr:23S rRNA (uracil(1939)-C(5))-methyltransferase RlmD [Bacillota bacterium]